MSDFNPLELKGPEFLLFYLVATLVAALLGLVLRRALAGPGGDPPPAAFDLHPLDVARLAGGPTRAARATLASLFHQKVLHADPVERTLKVVGKLPPTAHALEKAAVERVGTVGDGPAVAEALAWQSSTIEERLVRLGLVFQEGQERTVRLIAAAPLAAVLGLGAVKIMMGIDRHRPVGFLVLLSLGVVFLLWVFARSPIVNTRRGAALVDHLAEENKALDVGAHNSNLKAGAKDVALAVALFGNSMFASYWMADLLTAVTPAPRPYSGSSDVGGSGGSSCGSSCGGSCGGGCGGGCGGCS